jgi:peptide-methionine (S)-S-oxide reductase
MFFENLQIPSPAQSLPGRTVAMAVTNRHFVKGTHIQPPFPDSMQQALFALGCFWGAEKKFWSAEGVYTTAVGYAGGSTPNPTYGEVCSGLTGHAEAVLVVFDPIRISYQDLLILFWEAHNPTQGMRQGNDVGTQYRSVIFTHNDDQYAQAVQSRDFYQARLKAAGYSAITTDIVDTPVFYYAEDYHQQYLAKNPGGYCGLGGTGVGYVCG